MILSKEEMEILVQSVFTREGAIQTCLYHKPSNPLTFGKNVKGSEW